MKTDFEDHRGNDADEWGFFVRTRFGKKRSYYCNVSSSQLKAKKISYFLFLLLQKTFLFCQCVGLRMRREEPLGEDPGWSILIHSLFATRHPAHVLCMSPADGSSNKPHYPIYRIITMKSICHSKILQKIRLNDKRM